MIIKHLRLKKGLTLEMLSQHTGMTIAALSRIENGQSLPHLSTRKKIEAVLGKIDWSKMRMAGSFDISYLENESPEEAIARDIYNFIKSAQQNERKQRFAFVRNLIQEIETKIKTEK